MFTRYYFKLSEFVPAGVTFTTYVVAMLSGGTYDVGATKLAGLFNAKHGEDAVVYVDRDIHEAPATVTDDDVVEQKNIIYGKFNYIFQTTYERYKTLIDAYDSYAKGLNNHLFDKLKSTSQFNDTPQTTATGLDGDGYASTYTVNTVDYEVIDRLTKVSNLYEDLYRNWMNEFEGLFIEVD